MGRTWVVFAVLFVSVLVQGQWVIWEEYFEAEPSACPISVGWNVVDRACFYAEPEEVRNFPSGSKALYFGMIDKGKGTYENARIGGQGIGYGVWMMFEPPDPYRLDRSRVRVSFKYLREVEYYQWGDYDITAVFLTNQSRSVQVPIWVKSSKDPSEKKWRSFTSDVIDTTLLGTQMAIEFSFRPVDANNNNYFGWLVDDVKIEGAVVITDPASLGDWMVDTENSVRIYAAGGVQHSQKGYKWKIEGLPEGLRFSPQGTTAVISGTPVKAGVYTVKVTVTDYADEASKNKCPASTYTRTYTLVVKPKEDTGAHGKIEVNFEQLVVQGVTGPDIPGWTRSGLWHLNSYLQAACYFDRNTGNYDTGKRTSGELTSPKWDVSDRRGQEIRVEFVHYRDVENYPPGDYDKTYLQIRFDEGEWKTIWYKDSADKPDPQWTTESTDRDIEGNPIAVPNNASTMQIRFVFDSVDGLDNQHGGWWIQQLQIEFMAGALEIVTTSLPEGEVGVYYEAQLEVRGGTPPYDWTAESRLPRGLRLERNGKLCGIPEESVRAYPIRVKVTDQQRNTAEKELLLTVGEKTTLFCEDFEANLEKWISEDLGLWHRTKEVKGVNLAKHGYAMYYGKDDTTSPNYNTGSRTVGYLTSKEFDLDGAPAFKIAFDHWREVEFCTTPGYDKTYVQVRFLIGSTWGSWSLVWYEDGAAASEKAWTPVSVGPFSVPAGATKMQIRFVFDSVDRFYNNYVGWLIDNVKVTKESAAVAKALPALLIPMAQARGEIVFLCLPNPVRDVHTATFAVRGVEAERIRVEVYDLAGKLVWKGEALGNELTWHTEDLTGLPLANGVYLYRIYVKVGEGWLFSGMQKVVILR
jgi:hypothetical protein